MGDNILCWRFCTYIFNSILSPLDDGLGRWAIEPLNIQGSNKDVNQINFTASGYSFCADNTVLKLLNQASNVCNYSQILFQAKLRVYWIEGGREVQLSNYRKPTKELGWIK